MTLIQEARESCRRILEQVVAKTRFMTGAERDLLMNESGEQYTVFVQDNGADASTDAAEWNNEGNLQPVKWRTDEELLRELDEVYDEGEIADIVNKYRERLL